MTNIFQSQLLAENAVISYFFEQLSPLQNPRMLQRHSVTGLHAFVLVDYVVHVYGQGDGEGAGLADDGHTELNACEAFNIETFTKEADSLKILTFKDSGVAIINAIF